MTNRIVVGVDGSPESEAALAWAVAEAERRSARVEAVHTYDLPVFADPVGIGATTLYENIPEIEQAAKDLLTRLVDAHALPGVTVDPFVAQGPAGGILVDRSEGAELVVVGARGHGAVTSLLLGSVSQHVTHHAKCPVVIIPHAAVPDTAVPDPGA
ncbi:MAG: universal stress protein [Acidimicrobiia bacterium]|nr:universal stress protein [Acidimicrobiia bacterium]